MAYDKTYDEYIKRTQGQGEAMPKEMFEKIKNEKQIAEERENNYMKRKDSMDNIIQPQQGLLQPQQPMIQPQQSIIQPQQNSIQQLQQQIADAQRKNEIANLEQLYQKNVGGLTAERGKIDPLYASQTRQAVAQGEMQKKSFSDFLAEKGLSASGQAGQGEISRNVAMQGQLGEIQGRRGEATSDIERRLTDITQARDFGISGANTAADRYLAEQQLSGALRQQELDRADQLRREDIARQDAIRQQDIGREESRYAQETARNEQLRQQAIQREDQLRQQGYSREDAQNQAELERRQKEQAMQTEIGTIDRYANDYTAEINRRLATPDTADDALIPYLESAKTQKVQGIEQSKAQQAQAQQTAQQKFAEAQYDRAMEIWKTTGVANDFVSQTIGVPVGTQTNDAKYRNAQLELDKIKANKASAPKEKTDKQVATENYKAFEADFRNLLISDPSRATNLVRANRDELIRQKGLSTYNSLLAQAEALTNEKLKGIQNSAYNFYPQP